MANSSCLLVHLVWTTARRVPVVLPELDQSLHLVLVRQARCVRSEVLFSGAGVDHVHLIARVSPTISVARFVHRIKGASHDRTTFSAWLQFVRRHHRLRAPPNNSGENDRSFSASEISIHDIRKRAGTRRNECPTPSTCRKRPSRDEPAGLCSPPLAQ